MPGTILISELALDPRLQMRVKIDKKTVEEYAQTPHKLPPVQTVLDEDGKEWLWDGHYRVAAYKFRGLKEIPFESRSGTFHDAMVLAAGANAGHGKQLSPEDKKKKVESVLAFPDTAKLSSRAIAEMCNVSGAFVEKIRTPEDANASKSSERTASDGGKVRRPKKPKPDADPSISDTKAAFGFQMCARCARGNKPACAACIKKHLAIQAKKNRAPDDPFSFTVVYEALQTLRAQKKKFVKQYPDKESMHPEAVDAGIHELRVAFRTWYREATNQKPPEE